MTSDERRERGAALLLVLLALAVLMPLALGLSSLVLRRQRQVTRWQGLTAGRLAVEGAFDQAWTRISSREWVLRPGDQTTWRADLGLQGATVRVVRQPDVAVRVDGRILPATKADLGERVIDFEGAAFCPWRRLEIYLVEAEAEGTAGSPAVRLLGGVARLDDGRTLSLGYRVDPRGG